MCDCPSRTCSEAATGTWTRWGSNQFWTSKKRKCWSASSWSIVALSRWDCISSLHALLPSADSPPLPCALALGTTSKTGATTLIGSASRFPRSTKPMPGRPSTYQTPTESSFNSIPVVIPLLMRPDDPISRQAQIDAPAATRSRIRRVDGSLTLLLARSLLKFESFHRRVEPSWVRIWCSSDGSRSAETQPTKTRGWEQLTPMRNATQACVLAGRESKRVPTHRGAHDAPLRPWGRSRSDRDHPDSRCGSHVAFQISAGSPSPRCSR